MSECPVCGGPMPALRIRRRAKTCSRTCGAKRWRPDTAQMSSASGTRLSTGSTGAVSELMAAIDLTQHGFAVFRALSPASPCDLIALRGADTLRVEVRSGTLYPASGIVRFGMGPRDAGRQDIFAVVAASGISYFLPDGRTPWSPLPQNARQGA